MDQKESLLYLATKQFNLTEAEATTLLIENDELKDNAVDLLLEKDKERIQKLKDERTQYHDKGFKEAEKKLKSFAEEKFKELTGYSGAEDNFEAMFKAWQEAEKKKWQKNVEINEDQVKKHPAYIALESERMPKTDYEKLKSEYDEYKITQERNLTLGMVTNRAWDLVASEDPILEKNETVAANRRRNFLADVCQYSYEWQDKGDPIVIKDGKRLEDEHGNLITFKTFISDLSHQHFEFRAQSPKGNAGNVDGSGGVVISDRPTTAAEYHAALDKWNGASEEHAKMRIAIKNYYYAHKKD